MSTLIPLSFGRLVSRMLREMESRHSIFDLPARKFFSGFADKNTTVRFHGRTASTPLGPAAGPHSQMAQNIVLAWLGGSRIFELKTVQVLDELEIPRPCIDASNVCYNVEWSQELRLEQSLDEYVKASMLIEILQASGVIESGFDDLIFDMSVGYDLEGIRSDRVGAFIRGMIDASEIVERLRKQIPDEFAGYRDLDFRTRLCTSLTLSTFHGCPPDEIERIIDYLLQEYGLSCTIKLNPTLLGPGRVREIISDRLGYKDIRTPDSAFEKDAKWEQVVAFFERLQRSAGTLGLGVKFSNTLIVENHKDFFPESEELMYLSGQPLHVLAMELVRDFRRHFGGGVPVSFSAGIDRHNFADAVALGLTPITVCTDLLRPGGYARQAGYFQTLGKRMDKVGAKSIEGFILLAYEHARVAFEKAGGVWSPRIQELLDRGEEPRLIVDQPLAENWIRRAIELNTETYLSRLETDDRYAQSANASTPKKTGSRLELFDCVTCDKCVPVCPNDANFVLAIAPVEIPVIKLKPLADGRWESIRAGSFVLKRKHQIANYSDFCNECGNCDIFCPEDGGPYVVKPRFFGTLDTWRNSGQDGFWLAKAGDRETIHGRFDGREFALSVVNGHVEFSGDGFEIIFRHDDPLGTVRGRADGEVDMAYYAMLDEIRKAMLGTDAPVNYVNA